MPDHKLILLFPALQKTERHRLRKFLNSPYHNHRQDVLDLYEFLREWDWEAGAPGEEQVFFSAYPDEPFNVVNLRLLMSYLYKRIEAFLVLESMKKNNFEQEMILMKFYHERGLERGFIDTVRASVKNLEQSRHREANYFYQKFRVQERLFTTPSERSDADFQGTLQELSDHLDYFYIFSKLKYACGILSHQQLFKVEYKTRMMDEIVACVEAGSLWEIPSIGTYYYAYLMLSAEAGDAHFGRLMEMIRMAPDALLEEEVKSVYLLAINFCIRKVNIGKESYRQVLFDLYLEALEKGFLLEGGELLPWSYKNIISVGLKLKALDQVDQFVEHYKSLLPAEHRDSFYGYGRAELHLARGEFSKVIESLYPVQFKDPLMALNARISMIKAYFEQGEFELIEYQLDSFKHFLKRREMLSYHRENYKLFASICLGLIQLKPGDSPKRKKLMKSVEEARKLVGKEWLLEKLGVLASENG